MIKSNFLSFSLILILSVTATAQPEKSNSLPEVIKLFSGTWVGNGVTEDGSKFESRLVFKPVLAGNFLEARNYVVVDAVETEFAVSTYGWQPVLGHLVFWAVDKDGTINEGIAELAGNVLKHEWRSFSAGGEIGDWRSELQLNKEELTFIMYDGKNTASVLNKLVYTKQ